MTTNFDSVQTLKSSENCDKYSKSVSYETLVGGTATIGRECGEALEIEGVITRRTSVRRGYLPEQGTHANKESLFASVTCFMRLPRRIQRMLLRMTIPTLVLFLSLNLSPAFAGSCDCDSDGNTLTISNCSTISSLSCADKKGTANNVIIGTDVTSIGNNAFAGAKSLTSITIPDSVTSIGTNAFRGANSLTSITIPEGVTSIGMGAFVNASSLESITIPDSVTWIGDWAFENASSLESITIPESVTSIGDAAFRDTTGLESIIIPDNINTKNWTSSAFYNLPKNAKIVCQGDVEKCKKALAKYIPTSEGGTCTSNCLTNATFAPATETQCTGSSYYWSGRSCNNKKNGIICAEKWKRNEDFCNRIQYTPAEAAKVLRDDNTNEVTITFKK